MQDQVDRFEQYWKEGLSSIDYRLFMSAEKTAILEQRRVNEVVKDEIWTSRFGSAGAIRHGAAVFIGELKQEDPVIGNQVENRLANLRVNAGISVSFLAGVSLIAALFLLLLIFSFFAVAVVALKFLFGLVFIVSAACALALLQKNASARKTLRDQLDRERNDIVEILRRMGK